MQKYMKSTMPYLGIMSTPLREICGSVFLRFPLELNAYRATSLSLWRGASFREERYAAIQLSGFKAYRSFQTPTLIPMYEEMIVAGAWWDYVDTIAIDRIGPILRTHRAEMTPILRSWSTDGDMWKRRTAIIAQVGLKDKVDFDLLVPAIVPNLADREFFIRKAIGWALRQDAKRFPERVEMFVRQNEDRLSGLSRREALKGIGYGRASQAAGT